MENRENGRMRMEREEPKGERKGGGKFEDVMIGRNAVSEALRVGRQIDSILVARGSRTGSLSVITARAREKGIPVKEVDSTTSFWGADIYIYVENNTDQDVTVQAANTSLNGFMVEPYFSCDVTAGKKAYDTITFMESDLEENDITKIDTMEISFHVFDTANYNTVFDTDPLSVSFE